MMDGLPTDVFVDQLVRPVRAITDRAGKGWRSMGLLLASSVVGGEASKLERSTEAAASSSLGPKRPSNWRGARVRRRASPCARFGPPVSLLGTAAASDASGTTTTGS